MRSALRSVGLVLASGVVLGLMLTVCNWLGPASRWVASVVPRTPARWVRSTADGVLYGLGLWGVQAGILAVLAATLVVATVRIVHRLLRVEGGALTSVTVGLAILFASLVSLLLVFSTAVAVDLLITCVVEQEAPMIGASGHLEWYAWHAFDVLPELTVPRVLGWSEPKDPTAIGRGLILLFVKLVAVLVIAVPVARVFRTARESWSNRIG